MIPNEKKLLDVLSNHDVTFFIPPYQRNYEWTDEQCKVFFTDVIKTEDANSRGIYTEHFFGAITYFETGRVYDQPNKLVLIDGQQRITTTMLFLVALRDILDDEGMRQRVDSRFLKNNDVNGDSEYKIKLKQVETDWSAYKKIVLSEKMTVHEKKSKVFHNYQFFYNKLALYKKTGHDLRDIIEKGLSKFSVITIELQPDRNAWENPQEIFESMNSLGKPLFLADLVRNYLLLGRNPDEQDELYKKYWLHIENTLPDEVSNFIRDYMQVVKKRAYKKASATNSKYLYGQFKLIFSDVDSKLLLRELSEYADIYSYIISDASTGDKKIDDELKDIRTINVSTANSFFMALLRHWKENLLTTKDVLDILHAFKIYCIRRRILGLAQGENKALPVFVNYLEELKGANDKKQRMFELLANQENNVRLPNDIELSRNLESSNFFSLTLCKYILSLVEEKITKSRPALDDNNLQTEHIMPQTLSNAWKEELGEDYESIHRDFIHNIGNLTLIRHNQELGNKPFAEKKELYENTAGLQIAKTKIIDKDHWNETTIKERRDWIVDYLLSNVLPIPEDMRRANNFKEKVAGRFSFNDLNLIGQDIEFFDDHSIVAHVVNDTEVEFEGKNWNLSPLTKEIRTRRGMPNRSGSYSGAQYWSYDGTRLSEM